MTHWQMKLSSRMLLLPDILGVAGVEQKAGVYQL